MPVEPIIAPSRRRSARIAVVAAITALAVLSIVLHDRGNTSFDTWALRELYVHIGDGWKGVLLGLTTPMLSIIGLGLIAVGAAIGRRWEIVALAVVGPVAALVLTEIVLKPVVDRHWLQVTTQGVQVIGPAFPSGHETGLVSMLLVLAVLSWRIGLAPRLRIAVLTLLALWGLLGAVGLVRGFYHYTTDTVGAVAVSAACVLGTALAIDAVGARIDQRRSVAVS
jgi:membrane-associated phospholipid phosphatase